MQSLDQIRFEVSLSAPNGTSVHLPRTFHLYDDSNPKWRVLAPGFFLLPDDSKLPMLLARYVWILLYLLACTSLSWEEVLSVNYIVANARFVRGNTGELEAWSKYNPQPPAASESLKPFYL